MEIISREAAKAQGLKLFFTGTLCSLGHASERYVSTGGCRQCALEKLEGDRDRARESVKRHYATNRSEILEKKRLYYEANREVVKARSRAYRENLPTKPAAPPRKIDLTGNVFGKLTVVREANADERGESLASLWVCNCECGAANIVRDGYALRKTKASGGVSSCGCASRGRPPRNRPRSEN